VGAPWPLSESKRLPELSGIFYFPRQTKRHPCRVAPKQGTLKLSATCQGSPNCTSTRPLNITSNCILNELYQSRDSKIPNTVMAATAQKLQQSGLSKP